MHRKLRTIALLSALPLLCVPLSIAAAPPPAAKSPAPKPKAHPNPHRMPPFRFVMMFPNVSFPTNAVMFGSPQTTLVAVNPVNRALSPYSPYASNPYAAYPMMMPAYYPMPAYGSGTGNSNPYSTDMESSAYNKRQLSADETASVQSILGLPGEKGKLSWPLGLRILAPAPEAEALRQQIDGLVLTLAYQEGSGQVQSGTVDAAKGAVRDLRRLLHRGEGSAAIAEYTYQEANRFLGRLDTAIRSAGAVNSAGQRGY